MPGGINDTARIRNLQTGHVACCHRLRRGIKPAGRRAQESAGQQVVQNGGVDLDPGVDPAQGRRPQVEQSGGAVAEQDVAVGEEGGVQDRFFTGQQAQLGLDDRRGRDAETDRNRSRCF